MPLLFFLIGAGLVALSHVAPFPMLLDLNVKNSVWRMPHPPGQRIVYLTYDDGPNPTATPALLDLLARERVPATFFLIDRHLTAETAPIVRRMFEEGHRVALHSDTRRPMLLEPGELAETLNTAALRIERLAGGRPCRAFRPHAGARSGQMLEGLRELDYTLVGWGFLLWDADPLRPRKADRIARRLLKRASPGDIVVMHDGHHENPRADRQYAIDATAQLLPALRRRGFSFGTICGPDGAVPGAETLATRR